MNRRRFLTMLGLAPAALGVPKLSTGTVVTAGTAAPEPARPGGPIVGHTVHISANPSAVIASLRRFEDEFTADQYASGALTTAEYRRRLRHQLDVRQAYSDDWMRSWTRLNSLKGSSGSRPPEVGSGPASPQVKP